MTGEPTNPLDEIHEPRDDDPALGSIRDAASFGDDESENFTSNNNAPAPPIPNLNNLKINEEPEESSNLGDTSLRRVANLIKSGKAKNIIFLLGAGISTSAGIPDFRSPKTGLYHNLQKLNLPFPEAVFELGFFKKRPGPFWELAREIYPGKYFPTPTHYFLNQLNQHGLVKRIFTQNIDTLETLAGCPEDLVVEAHGSFAKSHCLTCRKEVDRTKILEAGVREGKVVRCDYDVDYKVTGSKVRGKGKGKEKCGGLVKPDIVFFGEDLPDRFFDLLPDLKQCDLLLVIGTSLQVQPFASLVDKVPASCPRLLINREPVGPFTRTANRAGIDSEGKDMYYEGDADSGVYELAEALGWRDELEEMIEKGNLGLRIRYKESETPRKPKSKKTAKDEVEGGDADADADEVDGLEEVLREQLKL